MKKILLLFALFGCFSGFSQEKEDPTVGLVLSGGGAKGLAHIGALKVIEEAGIQIDYIGGTSMGAIIGGLYASGYSAEQLDSLFRETNFDILIQDALPRSAKTFYEKRDAEKYALTLPFNNFNISFPTSLSRGQNLFDLLSRLTLHLREKRDFSKLPIPFFCVAANVETGEEVVLESGYLPEAISASAAIPTIFSPVLVDGKLLTDGGVVNNYPVEEMLKRGADIIIGVDVQDSLVSRDKLKSVFEILTQISNFRTIEDMKEKIKKTDVYIDPEIADFSVISFDQGQKIIDAGAEAAQKKIEELKEIASLQKKENRPKIQIKNIDSLYIADVRIEGNQNYPRAYIFGKLKLDFPSQISYKDFHNGINNLAATGNFKKVSYQLLPLNEGYVLVLQLEENPNKMFLRMALHYDNLYKSGALINLTRKSLFLTNDVVSADAVLGDNFRYNFEYYIDKGFYWSIGLRSRYNSFQKSVGIDFVEKSMDLAQVDVNRIAIEYSDATNQFYIETLFKKVFSVGIGAEHKFLEIDSETIGDSDGSAIPATVFDRSHYFSTFGTLNFDSYDNKYFPKKGIFFRGDFHLYLMASDFNPDFQNFSIAKGNFGYAVTPFPRFTTRISTGAGFQIGNHENNSLDFFLGGYGNDFINNIVPFYGYDFLELSGDSYIKGTLEVDYEIFNKSHLSASANFANVENDLFNSGEWFSAPDFSGYGLGYGLETFLGPLEVKYTFSPEVHSSIWFFSLGFWF